MAVAVRELRPTAAAPTAPVRPAPIPTAQSKPSTSERTIQRKTTRTEPRRATEARPRDPYDQPVNPWLVALYLGVVFLVLDLGMLWAGARLVAGTGG